MSPIYHKLEIDVMQAVEVADAVELCVKYQIPTIVVHQELITQVMTARGARQGRFKIMVPVDWPKGEVFGYNKLHGIIADALEADGFELLLTPGKNKAETKNEATVLSDFIRTHLSQLTEVRFVLGVLARPPEQIGLMCEALQGVPAPSFIRTDIHTRAQVGKANQTTHNELLQQLKSYFNIPIKLCGNIGGVRAVTSCPTATRYAVNLQQAKDIIQEINRQPPEVQELVTAN